MDRVAIRAEKYRNKAEEVRIIAESMRDPFAGAVLLSVAEDYLNLAEMLDGRVDGEKSLPDLASPKL